MPGAGWWEVDSEFTRATRPLRVSALGLEWVALEVTIDEDEDTELNDEIALDVGPCFFGFDLILAE